MSNLVTAEYNDNAVAQIYDKNFRTQSVPQIRRFNNWPSLGFLLASLVAGATASRTSGVVTVTATARGITTGTTYVGCRYFYPGSPSLAAGWYDSILTIPDANTLTFSAAGADFGSESVNGGAAYTTATDAASLVIPGNTLKDQSRVKLAHLRDGSTPATQKTVTLVFGGSAAALFNAASSSRGDVSLSFRCLGTNKQVACSTVNEGNMTSGALTVLTKDITQDQTLTLRLTVASAQDCLVIPSAHVELTI